MKQKLKKIFKNKFILFIIAAIFCGTMGVYAVTYFPSNQVTYDNTSSQLSSTDVQGAIDELYNTCKNAASGSNFKAITMYVDYIYFSTNDGIYRMNTNGADINKLSSYVANALAMYGGYTIYFSTNDGIYRMNTNGADIDKLSSYVANALTISNYGYIFFSTDDGIYRMDQNGNDFKKLY